MGKPYYVTVGDRGGITLPSRLREELSIEAGDLLGVSVTEDGKIVLSPGSFIAKTPPQLLSEAEIPERKSPEPTNGHNQKTGKRRGRNEHP